MSSRPTDCPFPWGRGEVCGTPSDAAEAVVVRLTSPTGLWYVHHARRRPALGIQNETGQLPTPSTPGRRRRSAARQRGHLVIDRDPPRSINLLHVALRGRCPVAPEACELRASVGGQHDVSGSTGNLPAFSALGQQVVGTGQHIGEGFDRISGGSLAPVAGALARFVRPGRPLVRKPSQ